MKTKYLYALLKSIRLGRAGLLAVAVTLSAVIAASAMRLDLTPSHSPDSPALQSQPASLIPSQVDPPINTILVNSTADTANPTDGLCTLREAIRAANLNTASGAASGECAAGSNTVTDTINFSVTGTIKLASALPAANSVMTIDGIGQSVTISGEGTVRVLSVLAAGNLELNDLTIANGVGSGGLGGGGILNRGGKVRITHTKFENNRADVGGTAGSTSGGAIADLNQGSTISIEYSTFTKNIAGAWGGAIYSGASTSSSKPNCIYADPKHVIPDLTIKYSTFTSNVAGRRGGAIRVNDCPWVTITNSTFNKNQARPAGPGSGGGIDTLGVVNVVNSTFSQNVAAAGGGGIRNGSGGTLTVTNSTFSGNTASPSQSTCCGGGALHNAGGSIIRVSNTIIANSPSGGNCRGTITDLGGNLSWPNDNTCPGIHQDPKLGLLKNNGGPTETMAIPKDSPAVDKGLPAGADCTDHPFAPQLAQVLVYDQRGLPFPRRVDGNGDGIATCDIGAYEFGPALTTSAVTPVFVGENIHDTATIQDLVDPDGTGTITFTLYSDAACTNQVFISTTPGISSDGSYPSGDYKTTAAGNYYWLASYSGDGNNNPISTKCGDPGETSVVNLPATITTSAVTPVFVGANIHDTATIKDLVSPDGTGTITFTLYSDATCQTQVFTDAVGNIDHNGNYTSGDYTTTVPGSYYWIASFSGDPNNKPASTTCGDPGETSVVNPVPTLSIETSPNPPSGTVGDTLNDSASLTGGLNPTGTITFNLYAPSDLTCSGMPAFTETVPVNGSGVYHTTIGFPSNAVGVWRWTATYSDGNNPPISSGCNDEKVTIKKDLPSIATTPDPSSGTVGDTLNDSATLSDGYNPTGTITFNLYDPNDPTCSGTPAFTDVVSVDGDATYPTSNGFVSSMGGVWHWTATYSGDSNNEAASSDCADEPVTISSGPPIKVTGGGQIPVPEPTSKQQATFGFNADQTEAGSTAATGHFNYVNHDTGLHINGSVTEIQVIATNPDGSPKTVQFSGTCDGNGPACTFIVTVEDHGEPGTNDEFGITVTGDVSESQSQRVISKGNIQFHIR